MSLGGLKSGSARVTRMSSVYRRILSSLPLIEIPVISTSSLITWASGSMNNLNRVGLKGQPLRHPCSRVTIPERLLFILIWAVGK